MIYDDETDDFERDDVDDDEYFERDVEGVDEDGEFYIDFADPGGNSALRAATANNPRNLPCPDCGAPNRLTPADKARGYCCDSCADRKERGGDW